VNELVHLETQEQDGIVIAHLSGELDISVAPSLGDSITAAVPTSAHALVVDCTALEFIDSSGIAMLFSLVRRLGGRRQQLHVVAPQGQPVRRVLEIVEFDRAAPVHESLEEALAGLSADSR
jgi:anti-sigma B factor antagonist